MTDQKDWDEEVSLSDIASKLWRGRGIILIVPLFAIGIALLYIALSSVYISRPVTSYVALKGIADDRYPNGTAFFPQDLLSSPVISELRKRLSIPASVSLTKSIFVVHDAPETAGITQIYRDKLSGATLTQSEIQSINSEYQQQLDAATQSSLRIDVNYQAMGIDEGAAEAIAGALPEVWSDVYSTSFRIFDDSKLANVTLPSTEEGLDSIASILLADSMLKTMGNGLDILQQDNRLSMLQTDDGVGVADLKKQLENYQTAYFDVLRMQALDSNDPVATVYLAGLRLTVDEYQRNISRYDSTLAELQKFWNNSSAASLSSQPQQQNSGGGSLQLDKTALTEIISLASTASLSTYVQEVLQNRQQLAMQLSEVQRKLQFAALEESLPRNGAFVEEAAKQFAKLVGEYSATLSKANDRLRADTGKLYTPLAGPMVLGSAVTPRAIFVIIVAAILGGMLAAAFVLLRSGGDRVSARRPSQPLDRSPE